MNLTICVGESCHLKGSEVIIKTFMSLIEKENLKQKINLKGSFCMGKCSDKNVTLQINNDFYKLQAKDASEFFYSTILPILKQ